MSIKPESLAHFTFSIFVTALIFLTSSVFAQSLIQKSYNNSYLLTDTDTFPNVSEAKSKKITLDDEDETPHILVGGYYNNTNGYNSKLLLNNKSPLALEVQPILYNKAGQMLQIPPITVPRRSHQTINLRDWADVGGESFQEGSVELFHRGKDLVLGTQIQVYNENKSLVFENRFGELEKFDSRHLESVWWMPNNRTKSYLIMTNSSDEYLIVRANLTTNSQTNELRKRFDLLPNETKVVDISDFDQNGSNSYSEVLALSLKHNGKEDSLIAKVFVEDERKGYSNVATFRNPKKNSSKEYHGTGLQIGKVNNKKLEQIVILKNTSNKPSTVKIKVPYTKENGNKKRVKITPITLEPGDVHKVNMSEVDNLSNVKTAGIEIKYSGKPGRILASSQTVSKNLTHVFRTILWDAPALQSPASVYPFSIEENSTTKAYIKNAGFKDEEYYAYITWENSGEYMFNVGNLKVGETIELDVKQIRDNQIPDKRGNTIPMNLTKGQIHWSLKRSETNARAMLANRVPLIGQMLQVNTSDGMSFSYFCLNCCGSGESQYKLEPATASSIDEGQTVQYTLFKRIADCYGGSTNWEDASSDSNVDWDTSNSYIATVNDGLVTGHNNGLAEIEVSFWVFVDWYSTGCGGGGGGDPIPFVENEPSFGNNFFKTILYKKSKTGYKRPRLAPGGCYCQRWVAPVTYSRDVVVNNPPQVEAQLSNVDIVEKNGTKDVTLSFASGGAPSSNDTVKLKLERTSGTGSAVFDSSGTDEVTYSGSGGASQTFKIKGVTESSQANNYKVKVLLNGSSNGQPSKTFTVAVINSIEFERINTTGTYPATDLPFDNNPGTDGTHTNGEGLRIYPDKNLPNEQIDRSLIRVKAVVSPSNIPNVRVYFASFDLDDPSATGNPIDGTGANGNDNNGNVNNSKSGVFSNPQNGGTCGNTAATNVTTHISTIDCAVSTNQAVANYKTTMQPGDNFAVATSLDSNYREQFSVNSSAGINIINNSNQTIPISGETNSNNVRGIRTKMLTVWRRLHLEIDTMANVPTTNRVTGTITSVGQNTCPTPPNGCTVNTLFGVNPQIDLGRFENGRIRIGSTNTYYQVQTNNTQFVILNGTPAGSLNVQPGTDFTLYDDDDYNDNDGTNKDGDSGEAVNELGETFNYLEDQDGNYPDGRPRNVYRSAYITPTRNWAENIATNYIQNNVTFNLNVPDSSVLTTLNANRNSSNNESDEFWIAYFLVSYQGETTKDADGLVLNTTNNQYEPEGGVSGIASGGTYGCDCRTAPCVGRVCPNGVLPNGAVGALIFQEVMQDVRKAWLQVGTTTRNIGGTAPHELGHQFGIRGDNKHPTNLNGLPRRTGNTYLLMDYVNYQTETLNYALHPEHINLIRRRMSSPGQ